MTTLHAAFRVGQLVHHKRFDYRGLIADVDAEFQGSERWYAVMARSRPPKDKPWYHVLVHDAEHWTYVAEQNLEPDDTGRPISHPDLAKHFAEFRDGAYVPTRPTN